MSVLHFLPRITSWSNLYKNQTTSSSDGGLRTREFKQDLVSYQLKLEKELQHHDMEGQRPQNYHRKKISYWSDEEGENNYTRFL